MKFEQHVNSNNQKLTQKPRLPKFLKTLTKTRFTIEATKCYLKFLSKQ